MRSLVVLLAIASLPVLCSAQVPECFVGRWKSDEARTLADMRKHPEVSEKARALFENKKFFGRLVLIFGPRHVGSYFEGEQSPDHVSFERVDVVASGRNSLTLRSRASGEEMLQKWACEDGRIYAVVTRWEFREYFSPLP
jgi:hypothetical protein